MRYYLGEPLDSEQKREAWEILMRFFAPKTNQFAAYYNHGSTSGTVLTKLLGSRLNPETAEKQSNGGTKVRILMNAALAEELITLHRGLEADDLSDFRLLNAAGESLFASSLYGTDTLFDCSREELEQLRQQLDVADLDYRIDVLGTAKEYRDEGDEALGITRTKMLQLWNRTRPKPPWA